MPSKKDHLWQADHNESIYSELVTTEFLDWAVTAIFYSALHYVDAYLVAKIDHHPLIHAQRRPWLAADSNLRRIAAQYQRLKNKSEAARYWVKHFTQAEVKSLKENEFEVIKSHISRYL